MARGGLVIALIYLPREIDHFIVLAGVNPLVGFFLFCGSELLRRLCSPTRALAELRLHPLRVRPRGLGAHLIPDRVGIWSLDFIVDLLAAAARLLCLFFEDQGQDLSGLLRLRHRSVSPIEHVGNSLVVTLTLRSLRREAVLGPIERRALPDVIPSRLLIGKHARALSLHRELICYLLDRAFSR